jgi:hypothetical protein
MPKLNASGNLEETYTYYGRGSKPLYHIQTPSVTNESSDLLFPSRLCIGQDNNLKQDIHRVSPTGENLSRGPSLASEQAFLLLLPLLQSNTPWKVTSKFLFNVCQILKDNLARFGIATPNSSSDLLVPVLRIMRIWRIEVQEERSLESLATGLAGLTDLELSCDSCKHANKLKCDSTEKPTTDGEIELQEKENILSSRIPPHRKHRSTSRITRRRAINSGLTHLPHAEPTSVCRCDSFCARAASASGCQSGLRVQPDGTLSHSKPPTLFLNSHIFDDTDGVRYEVSLD